MFVLKISGIQIIIHRLRNIDNFLSIKVPELENNELDIRKGSQSRTEMY